MVLWRIKTFTVMNKFQQPFDRQVAYFNTGITRTYEWRIEQLDRLASMLRENQQALLEALGKDFKTALSEQVFEVAVPQSMVGFVKSQLKEWMEPVQAPIPTFLAETGHKGIVYREPYGVTLVMGPFNGPLLLLLKPAVTALSAGNTVILKANSATPATTELLLTLVPAYFQPEAVSIVEGDIGETAELLKLPFNFIFFTGSTRVGKIVLRAAADNLTPVILELGGQNPAIVDETANIADAAKKIAWGATSWGGQVCTSPGFALVHESVADEFVQEAKRALKEMYGDSPKNNPDFSRIISAKEVRRLASLIEPEQLVYGGRFDDAGRYFEPTILFPVKWSDRVMKEEIFGPMLPVITYSDLEDEFTRMQNAPRPLAAYLFSTDEERIAHFHNRFSFGGGAINQVNTHIFIATMAFGGVGNSGMGQHYGKYGFDSLTHPKSVLYSPADQEISHLLPPFTMEKVLELEKWAKY